jgi:hypothetical protein
LDYGDGRMKRWEEREKEKRARLARGIVFIHAGQRDEREFSNMHIETVQILV